MTLFNEGNNDIIDRLAYPFFAKLAKYIPQTITPNQLTILGFLCGIFGSLMLMVTSSTQAFVVIFFSYMGWWVFDSLDGIHARLTNQTSKFGGFLDHFCDNLHFLFFFSAIVIHYHIAEPFLLFLIFFRLIVQAIVYLYQEYTRSLYLPSLSSTFELMILIALAMLDLNHITFYKNNIIGAAILGLGIHDPSTVKCGLLLYSITLPLTLAQFFYKAKNHIYEQ